MKLLFFISFVTLGLPFLLLSFWLFLRWINPKKLLLEESVQSSRWEQIKARFGWNPSAPAKIEKSSPPLLQEPVEGSQGTLKMVGDAGAPEQKGDLNKESEESPVALPVLSEPSVSQLIKEIMDDAQRGVKNGLAMLLWQLKKILAMVYIGVLYLGYAIWVFYWFYPIKKELGGWAKSSYINSLLVCFSLVVFATTVLSPVLSKDQVVAKEALQYVSVKYIRQQAFKADQGYVLVGKNTKGEVLWWRCSSSLSTVCFNFQQDRFLQGKTIEVGVAGGLVYEMKHNGEALQGLDYEHFVGKWTISFWQWVSYLLALYCALYSVLGTLLRYKKSAQKEIFSISAAQTPLNEGARRGGAEKLKEKTI